MTGAAWYGLLSVLWQALFSNQPVQQSLAKLFFELGSYLKLKASLFEPVRTLDVEATRLELAKQNGKVVAALNAAKEIILHRVGNSQPNSKVSRYLKLYFLAQDIHERVSASHYPYNALTDAFFHSDVMFRCQRLLRKQGSSCQELARSIRLRQPFVLASGYPEALEDLNASLEHLRTQNNPAWRSLLALAAGTGRQPGHAGPAAQRREQPGQPGRCQRQQPARSLAAQLQGCVEAPAHPADSHLVAVPPRPAPVAGIVGGLWHGSPDPPDPGLLDHPHHIVRLPAQLWRDTAQTGATDHRHRHRPDRGLGAVRPVPQSDHPVAVRGGRGVVFFVNRTTRYTLATAAITLMVLFCFNQIGDGYGLFLPRLFDTLVGSLIAILAVFLFLPDWQGRRLNKVLANTLACASEYLRQIMQQYAHGKRDDLAYRLARRNAHNADAALSTTLANMLMEPGHFRKEADVGFRFLVLSHTLLSYLSGLGAHRDTALPAEVHEHLIEGAGKTLAASLDELANGLAARLPVAIHSDAEEALANALEQMPEELDEHQRLVQTQLALICRQLGPLRTLAGHLLKESQPA